MNKDFLNWALTNKLHNIGYDGYTHMWIDYEEDIINDNTAELIGAKPAILCSTAFRWFREKYNLKSWIQEHTSDTFIYEIRPHVLSDYKQGETYVYTNYEEAELACFDKLIEIVEQNESSK
jgi:hypothetical protein